MVLPALAIPLGAAVLGGVASGAAGAFFNGTPEKRENVPMLRKEQEPLFRQLQAANMQRGAGGSFGESADYYRDLLSNYNDQENYNDLSAPIMRQYNEDVVPGLSEQFAGMGAGGLSSSGFRNAQIQGATDLSERLGTLRANLRQNGNQMRMNAAQGLTGLGQIGLQNYSQNMTTQQGSQGLLGNVAPAFGQALGTAGGNWIANQFNQSPAAGAGAGYNAGYNAGVNV